MFKVKASNYKYIFIGSRRFCQGIQKYAKYRIVRTCCGQKSLPSDFQYVITGLAGDPKSACFFTFSVVKYKLMIRFENIRRPQTRDIISQNFKQICDVISGFIFKLKSAIFCSFHLLTFKPAQFSQQKSDSALRTASLIHNI